MALSPNQQAQVNLAQPSRKAALRALYTKQNSTAPGKSVQSAKPRPAPAQPKRVPQRQAVAKVPRGLSWAFDGFDKRHLPTDDTTAPYATTNFLNVLEFGSSPEMDKIVVVGMRVLANAQSVIGPMCDTIAVVYNAEEEMGGVIPILQNVRSPIVNTPPTTDTQQGLTERARLHNMSVRLSCLGTNTGLYPPGSAYVGAVPRLEISNTPVVLGTGHGKLREAWAQDSISVGYIRSVSAASLVKSPVVTHSAVAESVEYKSWDDISIPATGRDIGSLGLHPGLEPIVIYVPRAGAGDTVVNYRVEIGQQWCSRHPNNVIIRATQKQHPATPSTVWNSAISSVKDIGEHLLNRAGQVAIDAVAARTRQALMNQPLALAE